MPTALGHAVFRLRRPLTALLATLAACVLPHFADAQAGVCTTDSPSGYTVTLCLAAPENNATLNGAQLVTATAEVSAAKPKVAKLTFYLDGQYLLTDYEAPFTFVLSTAAFADGAHTLSVEALLLDDFITSAPAVQLTFTNPQPTPPAASFEPVTPSTPPGHSPIMAAVGDGASGEANAGRVTDLVAAWDPDLFLYLGDVYEKGTYTEFYNWYGEQNAFFGRLRAITNPVIGNHEYENGDAYGYFTYWHNVPSYYSYDAGGWHFIALNSTSEAGLTDAGSAQHRWLVNDLNSSNSPCAIAYYHHPLLSIGPEGGSERMQAIYSELAGHGVDIILAGHEHNYQRWVPLDATLHPSAQGTTQFVAGAGGHGVQEFVFTDARLAVGSDNDQYSFGALYFKLNPKGAEFRYINTDGQVLDQGVIPCSGAAPDTAAPAAPTHLTATTSASGHVALQWEAAWDETGVSSYNVYRNDLRIATLTGDQTGYTDRNVGLAVTYQYQVEAVDALGHRSPKSISARITRAAQATLTFHPLADSYVQSSTPDDTYGDATVLKVDGSPDTQSFLRFYIQGVDGAITSATLRLYANSGSGLGYTVHPITGGSWTEMDVNYAGKPSTGDAAASSGSFTADAWTQVELRPLITGNGLLEVAIKTSGSTAMNFSSCEGSHPPELIITTASSAQAAGDGASAAREQTSALHSNLLDTNEDQRNCPYLVDPATLVLVNYTHAVFLPEVAGQQ